MIKFFKKITEKKKEKEITQTDFTNPTVSESHDLLEVKSVEHKSTHDLIVDDSNPNRLVLSRYLSDFGRTADEANNGESAYALVKSGKEYSIIWMDIQMPKMDGMDLLDRIKKEDDKIKVCFFTASEEFASNYTSIFNNSKDKFLIVLKPISIPIMTKQIEQFLSQ